jgi:hypothetical protein
MEREVIAGTAVLLCGVGLAQRRLAWFLSGVTVAYAGLAFLT